MDSQGNIYRECKCGERVYYDRDCDNCGAKGTTAAYLAEMFRDAVIDEIPDPLGSIRDSLIREDGRRRNEKKDESPEPDEELLNAHNRQERRRILHDRKVRTA